MTESGDSLIGAILAGRYSVTQQLGAGGMGEVYLATDANLDFREVVVKAPLAELMVNRTIRERFLDEVRNLARQKHPHIVKIQDFGEHEGRPYCVVEFLEGGSLADRLEASGGRLEAEEIMEWLPTIAQALDFVHRAGLVHRDVKPANILFDASEHAYLSDFGIATVMEAAVDDTTVTERHTQLGGFVGAPAYAPPEAVDRDLSPAYDQYSLAVVVYSVLSGRLPFEGKTPEAILVNKGRREPIRLESVSEGISPACAAAVMRALERDPRQRFPSCASFAEAFAAGIDNAVSADPKSRLPWWLGLAAAAMLGVALLWNLARDEEAGESISADPAQTSTVSPALPVSPVFQAGSTQLEIDAALALCERYQGAGKCERSWYTSEHLHAFVATQIELDRTEVTNRQFAEFARATAHRTQAERIGESRDGPVATRGLHWRRPSQSSPVADFETLLDVPVVHVSLADARAYCAWRGDRLPSPDEWEFAARGSERRIFPWGDEWDDTRATWWSESRSGPERADARASGATPEGYLGLAGNVWEWTESASGEALLKGGSYLERNPANLRAAASSEVDPTYTASDTGFRCARDFGAAD